MWSELLAQNIVSNKVLLASILESGDIVATVSISDFLVRTGSLLVLVCH